MRASSGFSAKPLSPPAKESRNISTSSLALCLSGRGSTIHVSPSASCSMRPERSLRASGASKSTSKVRRLSDIPSRTSVLRPAACTSSRRPNAALPPLIVGPSVPRTETTWPNDFWSFCRKPSPSAADDSPGSPMPKNASTRFGSKATFSPRSASLGSSRRKGPSSTLKPSSGVPVRSR